MWIIAFTVTTLWLVKGNRDKIHQLKTAQVALCNLRTHLRHEVESTDAFLRQNPKGIPGIPVKLIKSGQAEQRQTLNSLKPLRCKEV